MTDPRWPLAIYQAIPSNWRQPLGATLLEDGALHIAIPGVLRGGPEIGYYVHHLGPERALEFRALIEQHNLWELPNFDVVAPDHATVLFMEGKEDDMRSVMWPIDAIAPEVLPILDVFNRLVDEAYASPKEVLAGHAHWGASSFSAREPLQIEITLQNKGTDSISLQNPMAPQPRESLLELVLAPTPPPVGRARRPHSYIIRVTALSRPDQLRPYEEAPPGEILELAPGQSLRFAATPSIYLSPGEYQGVLTLNTGWTSRGPRNHVRGLLAMELPQLRIVHR